MIQEGQVVLLRFPTTDMAEGKLRPAVVVRKLPGPYEDWPVCMISSQINRAIDGFDEVISTSDSIGRPACRRRMRLRCRCR